MKTFIQKSIPATKAVVEMVVYIGVFVGKLYLKTGSESTPDDGDEIDILAEKCIEKIPEYADLCVEKTAECLDKAVDPCVDSSFAVTRTIKSYIPWCSNTNQF